MKKRLLSIIAFLFFTLVFSSCYKEERPEKNTKQDTIDSKLQSASDNTVSQSE